MEQRTSLMPAHVAVIMDGNGRWAERRGQSRWMGHVAGGRVVKDVVAHCARAGVAQLTLYAFSSDNWNRPADEVAALLALFESHFTSQADELAAHGIALSVIGRRTRLPLTLRRVIADVEQRTAAGRTMQLRIALDYSSRAAIRGAMRAPTTGRAAAGGPALLPPVDLLVRTGGERRLSDFLLWECAYAELLFLDVLWPDVDASVLDAAFRDFAQRERRYGRVPQRVSA